MSIGSDSEMLPAKLESPWPAGYRRTNLNIGLGNVSFITTTNWQVHNGFSLIIKFLQYLKILLTEL